MYKKKLQSPETEARKWLDSRTRPRFLSEIKKQTNKMKTELGCRL